MEKDSLLTIGRFAEIADVSAQRLRRYERAGILVPDLIDRETGYRYYALRQLNRAVVVRLLREVGVPLSEIAGSAATEDAGSLSRLLEAHRERLAGRLLEMQAMLGLVDQGQRSPSVLLSTSVTSVLLPAVPVVSRRTTLRRLPATASRSDLVKEIDAFMEPALERLAQTLRDSKVEPAGREIALFYNPLDWRDGLDCEVCLPVPSPYAEEDPECWVLPGGLAAQTAIQGMWYGQHIGLSALLAWADSHGFGTTGPLRECYPVDERDTTETRDYVTRSTWLLADEGAPS